MKRRRETYGGVGLDAERLFLVFTSVLLLTTGTLCELVEDLGHDLLVCLLCSYAVV